MIVSFFRTIGWFCYFFGALISFIPAMRKVERLQAQGNTEEANALRDEHVTRWATTLMHIAGVRVSVTGRENIPAERAVVFTPNHQGDYDVPLMLTCLDSPHGFVAKIETLKIPLVRTWMRHLGCVFLDRSSARQSMQVMHEAGVLLQNGQSMIVFPEGTRAKGGHMKEFKAGAFKMAFDAGAPIVPVVIDGSFRAMEANHNLMCPADIKVTILPPVETAELARAARKALPAQIAAQISALLPPEQAILQTEE